MNNRGMKAIAIFGMVFFWGTGAIYGFLYNWNFSAVVDYTTKYGYHGQLPLGVALVMSFIAGLVWGLVAGAFITRTNSYRRR